MYYSKKYRSVSRIIFSQKNADIEPLFDRVDKKRPRAALAFSMCFCCGNIHLYAPPGAQMPVSGCSKAAVIFKNAAALLEAYAQSVRRTVGRVIP